MNSPPPVPAPLRLPGTIPAPLGLPGTIPAPSRLSPKSHAAGPGVLHLPSPPNWSTEVLDEGPPASSFDVGFALSASLKGPHNGHFLLLALRNAVKRWGTSKAIMSAIDNAILAVQREEWLPGLELASFEALITDLRQRDLKDPGTRELRYAAECYSKCLQMEVIQTKELHDLIQRATAELKKRGCPWQGATPSRPTTPAQRAVSPVQVMNMVGEKLHDPQAVATAQLQQNTVMHENDAREHAMILMSVGRFQPTADVGELDIGDEVFKYANTDLQ